ncbi:ribosome biogenesis GTP-binding protein YsxC/EngB [Bradyrhizobium diazoefficiens]
MTDDKDAKLIEAGRKLFARDWQFIWASPSIQTLPPMDGLEIAFAGRSNVGKSSLINALTGRNALARTSHTPGRTQELIFFEVPGKKDLRLVDMPGYGYAKAPKSQVASWTELIHKFLLGRASLARVYVLIDARHGLKDVDLDILGTLDRSAVSYQIVLTKADQVKPSELASAHCRDRGRAGQASGRVPERARDLVAERDGHGRAARRDGEAAGRAELVMAAHRLLIGLAGLMGAAGVALAAASAHGGDASRLASASAMLLFHATAILATVALLARGLLHGGIGLIAASGFVGGAALFAGDLTLRQFAGHSLFPYAAPTGGTVMILSWLAVTLAAVVAQK